MSYDGEKIDALRIQIRRLEGLKEEIKKLNDNMYIFESLTQEIKRSNDLKEKELQYIKK